MNNTKINTNPSLWQNTLDAIGKIGVNPEDSKEVCLQKYISVVVAIVMSIVGIIWGNIYLLLDELMAGLIPIFYAVITLIMFIALRFGINFKFFHFIQNVITLLLPFLVMLFLGGFVNGSGVIVWGLFAPVVALMTLPFKKAKYWFIAFIVLVIISGIVDPYLNKESNLTDGVIILFFAINFICISITIFLILNHYVRQKNEVVDLMRKNRELELSYIQQEVMMRQNEKLAMHR